MKRAVADERLASGGGCELEREWREIRYYMLWNENLRLRVKRTSAVLFLIESAVQLSILRK